MFSEFSQPTYKNPRKLTIFLETNNLVLLLPRCASAPQRRRLFRATMAAAAHEILPGGIFERRCLGARAAGRCHPSSAFAREASVNCEESRREMQIFRSTEWECMETALQSAATRKCFSTVFLTHRVLLCFMHYRECLKGGPQVV